MIGLIITGHGAFSDGLLHATTMIAGHQEHLTNVCFTDDIPLETFQTELKEQIYASHDRYDGVLVLTDLKGGTPFNTSAVITSNLPNTFVLSGTNLPMVIEAILMSSSTAHAKQLAEQILQTGRDGIDYLDLAAQTSACSSEEQEGI